MLLDTSRLHQPDPGQDQRDAFARDHDRVLYSPEFKRLDGVTQVASATEGHVFHNRLTHSLKVSQLARRLAEFLREHLTQRGWQNASLPDPECAAAAGLAHDLGHPPFGHVAEETLNDLVTENGEVGGFEGNAQSFRIVTRLSAHRPDYPGLDLTVRTLNAVLKYPWLRDDADPVRSKKFGAYQCDTAVLEAIRDPADDRRSVEAQIMDLADDIAYGIHDLEDFWKAGLIPVGRLRDSDDDFESCLDEWQADPSSKVSSADIASHRDHLRNLLRVVFPDRVGQTFQERASLNRTMSVLIGEFFRAVEVEGSEEEPLVRVRPEREIELKFLQRLTWQYVIRNPRLATQQSGQARVVRELFQYYLEALEQGRSEAIPATFLHLVRTGDEEGGCSDPRLAADIVSSLGDTEAQALFGRVSGVRLGSILDGLHG